MEDAILHIAHRQVNPNSLINVSLKAYTQRSVGLTQTILQINRSACHTGLGCKD
jgi:hypothetical protein